MGESNVSAELRLDSDKPQHFIKMLAWMESSRNHERLVWCSKEIFLNSNFTRNYCGHEGRGGRAFTGDWTDWRVHRESKGLPG